MSRILQNFRINTRCYSKVSKTSAVAVVQKQDDSATAKKVQIKIDEEHLFGKKHTVRKLQQLLGVSSFTALGIANSHKNLSFANGKILTKNYELLKANGINNDSILKFPSLLATDNLEMKLDFCKSAGVDLNEIVPLLTLNTRQLENTVAKICSENRLQQLSTLLQMPKSEICEALTKMPFLKSINLDKVKTKLQLLLDNGIPIDDIQRDLWVLSYNADVIKNRLEMTKAMRVDRVKTWMVRCKPEVLDRYVTRRTDKKQILGDNSLAEYLSERLECSVEEAKMLMYKHPALQNKSMKKMKEILDFLFAQGFKPLQICRVPKILLHSVETTKQRLKELEPYGKHLDSLYMLTKSRKQYMQHFEALVKTSNKAKSSS